MTRTAIISDTDASLPAEVAAAHGIQLVPITIHFGDETLLTDHDINDEQLFNRVDREGVLPTTSAPSPGQFRDAFQAAFDAGAESIICINVSAEISATYSAAVTASEMFPDRRISVIDSKSLSMAQGFMVLKAAEMAAAGAPLEQILPAVESLRERTYLYAALSTLKYLAMSGRVGHLAAGLAGLMNVKPILTIQNGKLELLERVRTQSKASGRVIELVRASTGGRSIEQMAIVHVRALEEARRFQEHLCREVGCPGNVLMTELTPGLSVHSGAGLVGAAYVISETP
jgi:DegV family protein with EDD domain